MGIKIWWIWMILAAIFIASEIFTMGFFLGHAPPDESGTRAAGNGSGGRRPKKVGNSQG